MLRTAPAFALFLQEADRDVEMRDDDFEAHDAVFGEIAARPELRRCVSLDLPCVGVEAMWELLSSPHLMNLRRLNAPQSEAGPALHKLHNPTFTNLRWLNIRESNSAGGDAKIGAFTGSPHMSNLEYLDFSSNGMHGDDLSRLNESRHLKRLSFLNASGSDFSDFEVSYFLFCGRGLPSLKELDLSHCFGDLTDLANAVIEHAEEDLEWYGTEFLPLFTRLSKLWLRGNRITDAGANAIANYPKDISLTLLDLSNNLIGEDGKRAPESVWRGRVRVRGAVMTEAVRRVSWWICSILWGSTGRLTSLSAPSGRRTPALCPETEEWSWSPGGARRGGFRPRFRIPAGSVSLTPDHSRLGVCRDRCWTLFNLATGQPGFVLESQGPWWLEALHPSGEMLARRTAEALELWLPDGQLFRSLGVPRRKGLFHNRPEYISEVAALRLGDTGPMSPAVASAVRSLLRSRVDDVRDAAMRGVAIRGPRRIRVIIVLGQGGLPAGAS